MINRISRYRLIYSIHGMAGMLRKKKYNYTNLDM